MSDVAYTSDLPKIAADMRTAEQQAEDKLRGINIRAARQLLAVARRVVHVKTGRLRDGLTVEGPFEIATGTLEARIAAPSVPYAEIEAARGGLHDFATRTLEEGTDIIEQAADDMERALVAIMEGV